MSFIYLIRNKVTLNDLLIYLIFRPTELLTADDRAQLSSWIGQKCHFELLYKISRDSCCPESFINYVMEEAPQLLSYTTQTTQLMEGSFLRVGSHLEVALKTSVLFCLLYLIMVSENQEGFQLLNQIKQHLHIII